MYIWCGDDDSDFHREKHTVGDYAKWHLHIHTIVADGLYHRRGIFYVMAKVSVKPLGVFALLRLPTELFRARVSVVLKREGLIGDTFIANLMRWRHTSGFRIHNLVRITAKDETGITDTSIFMMAGTVMKNLLLSVIDSPIGLSCFFFVFVKISL